MAVPCPVPSRQVRFRDCYGMNTGFTAVACFKGVGSRNETANADHPPIGGIFASVMTLLHFATSAFT